MLQTLVWDTHFFGYTVCELTAPDNDYTKYFAEAKRLNVKLLVLKIPDSEHLRIEYAKKYFTYHDVKITFRKELNHNTPIAETISEYRDSSFPPELLNLAYLSGHSSRFKLDPGFQEDEFHRMYKEWLTKSVDKTLADIIFVNRHEGKINGFVTVKVKGPLCSIGLIAVAPETKGKGIGKMLLDAAEAYGLKNGATALEVPTQEINVEACKFYAKNGYTIARKDHIFNKWL